MARCQSVPCLQWLSATRCAFLATTLMKAAIIVDATSGRGSASVQFPVGCPAAGAEASCGDGHHGGFAMLQRGVERYSVKRNPTRPDVVDPLRTTRAAEGTSLKEQGNGLENKLGKVKAALFQVGVLRSIVWHDLLKRASSARSRGMMWTMVMVVCIFFLIFVVFCILWNMAILVVERVPRLNQRPEVRRWMQSTHRSMRQEDEDRRGRQPARQRRYDF